jgi:hypothetical protein
VEVIQTRGFFNCELRHVNQVTAFIVRLTSFFYATHPPYLSLVIIRSSRQVFFLAFFNQKTPV